MTKKSPESLKVVGEFFKKYRTLANLPVEEVATQLGVSRSRVQDYEAGIICIPFEMVFSLSNVLSIPPDEVVRLFYELSIRSASSIHPENIDPKAAGG